MPDSKITVEIVGDKRNLDRVLGGINSDVGLLHKGMVAAGAAVATAVGAAFVAIGAGLVASVVKFNEFEQGMNEVFTLLPGISGDAMREMEDQVLAFAREMNVLPNEVIPALYQALSAGVPPDNVFEFLETSVKLSKGGVTDLETAVTGLASVVNAYGAEIITAEEASDIMFTTVKLGQTTVGELASSLSNVTPIAASMGVAFSDVGAALATLTAQGTPTSQAVTGLRALLVELGDSGTDVGAEFERIAGQSFPEFIASGGNLGDAMAILQQISEETGIPVQQLFGSIEAGLTATQLTGGGLESLQSNIEAMGGAAGATDEAWRQMTQGLSEAWASLQAELAVVAIQVGRELAPAIEELAKFVEEHSDEIADFIVNAAKVLGQWALDAAKWLTDNQDEIAEYASVTAEALGTVIGWFGSLVDAVNGITGFVDRITGWSGALGDFAKSIANSIASVTPIGTVVDAFQLVGDTIAGLPTLTGFVDGIKGALGGAADLIIEFVRFTIDTLAGWAENVLDVMIAAFGWVPGLGDQLRAARDNVRDFRDNTNAFLDSLVDQVDIFFEGHDNVSPVIDNMLPKIRELQDEIYATYPGGTPSLDPQAGAPPISTGPGGSGGITVFDAGGVVPGAMGAPQMALVHGGETVLPTHKMSAEAAIRHVGLSRDDIAFGTAAGMQLAGIAGQQTNIGPVTVNAKSTDPDEIRRVLVEEHRRNQLLGAG